MKKLKVISKKLFSFLPSNNRIWQIAKAISLLRQKSFRDLFFAVKKDDICLDLGANIGYASLIMWLRGAKKIYALEPNFEAFKVLKRNSLGIKNILIFNVAISNKSSKEKLYLHKDIKDNSNYEKILEFSEASSLCANKKNLGECFYEVTTLSLDDFIKKIKIPLNIIKCDIEGGEYIIYDQLIEYAKNSKLRKIYVECHARKYDTFKIPHTKFMNLIKKYGLEETINTSWH